MINSSRRLVALAAAVLVSLSTSLFAASYEIDPVHSEIGFKIRHFVTKVSGRFNSFKGSFDFNEKSPEKSSVEIEIDVNSINTNNKDRDKHLRSEDFFFTKKYPSATFKSTKVSVDKEDKNSLQVEGDLTLRGVTKSVTLDVELLGFTEDPWGKTRSGFTATTKLNRKDFGIIWNKALDKGGFMLGDEVKLSIEIEAVRK